MIVILDMESDIRIRTIDPVSKGRLSKKIKLGRYGDQEALVRRLETRESIGEGI